MKKISKVIAICFVLILFSSLVYYYSFQNYDSYNEFNFYNSQISISQNFIKEKLNYKPDKSYHTLYRNFENPIFLENNQEFNYGNIIFINSINCSEGEAYLKDYEDNLFIYKNNEFVSGDLDYTKTNEYGCGFGQDLGFKENEEYSIQVEYKLNPENIFEIDGDYYTKFIIYSKNKHPNLEVGKNLIIKNIDSESNPIIFKEFYSYREDVLIYIPLNKNISLNKLNIIKQNNFKFDNSFLEKAFIFILFFSPTIVFFFCWLFFGKEKKEPNIPKTLSVYPQERKPWQVAAFFNSFFNKGHKNLFSCLIMDLYHRKILDIMIEKKEVYLKVNSYKELLDDIEEEFVKMIKIAKENAPKNCQIGDYVNLRKALNSNGVSLKTTKIYKELISKLDKKETEYYSKKGILFFILANLVLTIIAISTEKVLLIVNMFIQFFALSLLIFFSDLLIQFKKDYYKEYISWKSFKRYLNNSYTIKSYGHKGVIIWKKYLVYASALGVADKVLQELKAENLITEKEFNTYYYVPFISNNLSNNLMNSSHNGGGFSGASVGGIGGGGGGGR